MAGEGEGQAREAVSEIRHRSANTLQLLATLARMRGQKTAEPEVRRQMSWIADAIGALGALERHRVADGVDFGAYLAEMAQIWRRRQAAPPAEIEIDCGSLIVRDQTASTLALVVGELVGNALQHGVPVSGPHRVTVRVAPGEGEMMRLIVEDSGPGPAGGAPRERFGLWFVRSLASQVRGSLDYAAVPGGGTRMVLNFHR